MSLSKTLSAPVKRLLMMPHVEQRSEEWFAMRERMSVTGSDAAAILYGTEWQSIFKSRQTLFEEKTKQRSRGGSGAAALHGIELEDEALEKYCAKTGEKALLFGLIPHPKYDWIGASPDAVTHSGRLVEIKVSRSV